MLNYLARRFRNSCNVLNLRSLHTSGIRANTNNKNDDSVTPKTTVCNWDGLNREINPRDLFNLHKQFNGRENSEKQQRQETFNDWAQLCFVKWSTGLLCSYYASQMICAYARHRLNSKRWLHMERVLAEREFHQKNYEIYESSKHQKSFVPSKSKCCVVRTWTDEGIIPKLIPVTNEHQFETSINIKPSIDIKATTATQTTQENNVESALDELQKTIGQIEFNLGLHSLKANQPEVAVSHFRLASTHEHCGAIFNLGVCYEKGTGIKKNLRNAMQCYRRAANLGHKTGMYNLGVFYARGLGGLKKNRDAAKECFKAASQMGSIEAQITLGMNDLQHDDHHYHNHTEHLPVKCDVMASKLSLARTDIGPAVV